MAGVEIELRKPSMLHGKKGFERLVYAAKNVLNQSLTWLFCDLDSGKDQSGSSPLDQHHPTVVPGDPLYHVLERVLSPPFSQVFSQFTDSTVSDALDAEASYELIEWLGLVVLQSPRVLHGDSIDPYLSRYAAPEGSTEIQSLRIIKWQGLIGARWLTRMLNTCMLVSPVPFPRMSSQHSVSVKEVPHHRRLFRQTFIQADHTTDANHVFIMLNSGLRSLPRRIAQRRSASFMATRSSCCLKCHRPKYKTSIWTQSLERPVRGR
jgi:Ribonuclease P 40kDa (Rpp40) subunit